MKFLGMELINRDMHHCFWTERPASNQITIAEADKNDLLEMHDIQILRPPIPEPVSGVWDSLSDVSFVDPNLIDIPKDCQGRDKTVLLTTASMMSERKNYHTYELEIKIKSKTVFHQFLNLTPCPYNHVFLFGSDIKRKIGGKYTLTIPDTDEIDANRATEIKISPT
jgi:hypothetical protein